MFDWPAFLEQHRIEYATTGANVARGNIAIHCPLCGADDPSQHLIISLEGKGWLCRRRYDHRGSDAGLVALLLDVPVNEARRLLGKGPMPLDFAGAVEKALNEHFIEEPQMPPKMPDTFKPLTLHKPSCRPFVQYLERRGFTSEITTPEDLSRRYGLRYCTLGAFKGRIIFPLYHDGKLISWTGRTIHNSVELRYKALTVDPEGARKAGLDPACAPISHYLLWWDPLNAKRGDTLVLTEGPFDALKVDVLGRDVGIRATCFFTAAPTERQIALLHQLRPRYQRFVLLLDAEALAMTVHTSDRLVSLGIETKMLPPHIKDPGEIKTQRQLLHLLR